jgi:hypothetical protein
MLATLLRREHATHRDWELIPRLRLKLGGEKARERASFGAFSRHLPRRERRG